MAANRFIYRPPCFFYKYIQKKFFLTAIRCFKGYGKGINAFVSIYKSPIICMVTSFHLAQSPCGTPMKPLSEVASCLNTFVLDINSSEQHTSNLIYISPNFTLPFKSLRSWIGGFFISGIKKDQTALDINQI